MNMFGGLVAALATAACWTAAAMIFQDTVRKTPSNVINFAKVFISLLCLLPTAWLMRGHMLPLDVPPVGWGWLVASSLLGFVVCDFLLFEAFRWAGGRTSMVIFSLAPVFAALGGLIFMGEHISRTGTVGIIVALFGIVIATAGKPAADNGVPIHKYRAKGIAAAVAASVFQAAGYLLTKQGMKFCDSIGGTQIRLMAAVAGFMALLLWRREIKGLFSVWFDPRPAGQIVIGSLIGTYLGMVLSLYALGHAPAGVVATIFATPPVMMIPASMLFFKEKVTPSEVIGSIMAVSGIALLVAG